MYKSNRLAAAPLLIPLLEVVNFGECDKQQRKESSFMMLLCTYVLYSTHEFVRAHTYNS